MEQEYTDLEQQDHDTAFQPEGDVSPAAITGRFEKIALSLSGGGVRAVGFHLGTMGMLDRLGLLERVEIISTVSGAARPDWATRSRSGSVAHSRTSSMISTSFCRS